MWSRNGGVCIGKCCRALNKSARGAGWLMRPHVPARRGGPRQGPPTWPQCHGNASAWRPSAQIKRLIGADAPAGRTGSGFSGREEEKREQQTDDKSRLRAGDPRPPHSVYILFFKQAELTSAVRKYTSEMRGEVPCIEVSIGRENV